MKLKQRVGDFQVREQLADGVLVGDGSHRVYRVTKRKLTSREAARLLAEEVGVETADIGMCGLKDRQGITVQHMSVPHGRDVRIDSPEIKIDAVGFAKERLDSGHSRGNAFEIRVRDLDSRDFGVLRSNLDVVRECGVANYFDDQRFGNLTHKQGWIARDLMQDKAEHALRTLLSRPSPHDDERHGHFKARLRDAWGDWAACFDVAKRFREHHSIFEHLQRSPQDFKGAFQFVSSRLRLIHLYAYQSHLWNRAVAERLRASLDADERVVMFSEEGKLVSWSKRIPGWADRVRGFPLAGAELAGVDDADDYQAYRDVLALERMVPSDLAIEGVSGFQLKPENRPLVLRPMHLRVRPRERDTQNRGRWTVALRFELPRGAYATLVVKRLFATAVGERPPRMGRDRDSRDFDRRGGGGRRPFSGGRGGDFGGGRGRDDGRRGRDEWRDDDRERGGDDRREGRRDERGGFRRPGGGGRGQWRGRDDDRGRGGWRGREGSRDGGRGRGYGRERDDDRGPRRAYDDDRRGGGRPYERRDGDDRPRRDDRDDRPRRDDRDDRSRDDRERGGRRDEGGGFRRSGGGRRSNYGGDRDRGRGRRGNFGGGRGRGGSSRPKRRDDHRDEWATD